LHLLLKELESLSCPTSRELISSSVWWLFNSYLKNLQGEGEEGHENGRLLNPSLPKKLAMERRRMPSKWSHPFVKVLYTFEYVGLA
jgi:hypothetical protein